MLLKAPFAIKVNIITGINYIPVSLKCPINPVTRGSINRVSCYFCVAVMSIYGQMF